MFPEWEHQRLLIYNKENMEQLDMEHCCDLNHSTDTIFSDHFEGDWVGKSLF